VPGKGVLLHKAQFEVQEGGDNIQRAEGSAAREKSRRVKSGLMENGALVVSSDGEIRPMGMKKRKTEEKLAGADQKLNETLRGIQESLVVGNSTLTRENAENRRNGMRQAI